MKIIDILYIGIIVSSSAATIFLTAGKEYLIAGITCIAIGFVCSTGVYSEAFKKNKKVE